MRPTEPFRHEHQELLGHIEHLALAAREMPRLSEEERDALRTRSLDSFAARDPARAPRRRGCIRSGQSWSASLARPCRWLTSAKRSSSDRAPGGRRRRRRRRAPKASAASTHRSRCPSGRRKTSSCRHSTPLPRSPNGCWGGSASPPATTPHTDQAPPEATLRHSWRPRAPSVAGAVDAGVAAQGAQRRLERRAPARRRRPLTRQTVGARVEVTPAVDDCLSLPTRRSGPHPQRAHGRGFALLVVAVAVYLLISVTSRRPAGCGPTEHPVGGQQARVGSKTDGSTLGTPGRTTVPNSGRCRCHGAHSA